MEQGRYAPSESFLRVSTACPEVSLADIPLNTKRIVELYRKAAQLNSSLVVFPELSVTGYTLGDLVQQSSLLDRAKQSLSHIAKITKDENTAIVVGLPLCIDNGLYNCAAMLAGGKVLGIVPKSNLPTYNEFYEDRWYSAWDKPNTIIKIDNQSVPFGAEILFEIAGVKCGIEICEDLWVSSPPSTKLAEAGALLIVNPSASPEQISKAEYRRDLVRIHSSQLIAGYIYSGCDTSESTAEIVMGGHQLIATNGTITAERKPFSKERILIADIDIDHLIFDRKKMHMENRKDLLVIDAQIKRTQQDFFNPVERNPFLPKEVPALREERLKLALQIQANGLAMRLNASHQDRVILGLSGGLDSTLALLVAIEAADILAVSPSAMIQTLTLPGPASSKRTQTNAQRLAACLDIPNIQIPIGDMVKAELSALGHDGTKQDITYENVQARARTTLLFNYANMHRGIVLGTGDLSELALGWCTYNADQQSHYNVNASIPKTMVRHLVAYLKEQPKFAKAKATLESILDTPISPELTTTDNKEIAQNTEGIIGPYELHDFFLTYLVRWGDKPQKISFLAQQAFKDSYDKNEINHWLGVFTHRFASSQFKRETMPNGPKVGSISLSPRGDWRMPPDLRNVALWDIGS